MCDKRGNSRSECGPECASGYSASIVSNSASNECCDALRNVICTVGKRDAEADDKYQDKDF